MHGVIWSLQARLFFSQVFSPNWRDLHFDGPEKKNIKAPPIPSHFFLLPNLPKYYFPSFFFSHLFSILSKIQMDKFKNVVIKA